MRGLDSLENLYAKALFDFFHYPDNFELVPNETLEQVVAACEGAASFHYHDNGQGRSWTCSRELSRVIEQRNVLLENQKSLLTAANQLIGDRVNFRTVYGYIKAYAANGRIPKWIQNGPSKDTLVQLEEQILDNITDIEPWIEELTPKSGKKMDYLESQPSLETIAFLRETEGGKGQKADLDELTVQILSRFPDLNAVNRMFLFLKFYASLSVVGRQPLTELFNSLDGIINGFSEIGRSDSKLYWHDALIPRLIKALSPITTDKVEAWIQSLKIQQERIQLLPIN